MSDIPSLAEKDVEQGSVAEPEYEPPVMSREEGYGAVPGTLSGTDAVRHEADILFVTNYALEHGGVRSVTEFQGWMHRQMAQAARSGMEEAPSTMAPAIPEVETLARYLRMVGDVQHLS